MNSLFPFVFPVTVLLSGFALAQDSGLLGRSSISRNVGLHPSEGQLIGGGPGYKVRFGEGGITYTPAFGRAAPRTLPMSLRLESVRRGGSVWTAAAPARSYRDHTVRYERPGYEERYDVRLDGLKQSFVFDRLPGQAGDLVVRLRCDTELTPAVTGVTADALPFELPGVGAVVCGEVLGIDAEGREARGAMRCEHGVLELILPAGFVDSAALPLVLDPLIGTSVGVGVSSEDYENPDVAYDATNDVYCVVWEHHISASDADVRGQLVDAAGNPIGGASFLASGSTNDRGPKVANVNSQDAFVVVWGRSGRSIFGRAVDASSGVAGTAVVLASGTNNHRTPDIGGERNANPAFDDAILVWHDLTADRILARRVEVTGNALRPLAPNLLEGAPGNDIRLGAPAIAKSGGSNGRYLVVWEWRQNLLGVSHYDIHGAIITRNLGVADNLIQLNTGPQTRESVRPDVDGDGNSWVVAWQRSETGASDADIVCRAVRFSPHRPAGNRGYTGPLMTAAGQTGFTEETPAVCWTGGAVLVGYVRAVRQFSGAQLASVRSLNPYTCTSCETSTFDLEPFNPDRFNEKVAFGSKWSGGAPGDPSEALIAFDSFVSGSRDVRMRRFESEDGVVTILSGGCGTGRGIHFTACARVGHPDFQFTLRNAPPAAMVWLVMGFDRLGLSCGGCQLVPDPYTGWVVGATTDNNGDAAVPVPIPNSSALRGLRVYQQWIVPAGTTPACLAFQANFVTPTQVEIQ